MGADQITKAPAERFVLPDGTVCGVIASTTTTGADSPPMGSGYCASVLKTGPDLRNALRERASRKEVKVLIASGWASHLLQAGERAR